MMAKIHKSWLPYIEKMLNSPAFQKINTYLQNNTNYYPEYNNIFAALDMPFDNLKVVILGMDPYPQVDIKTKIPYATGIAFANPPEVNSWAFSLSKIEEAVSKVEEDHVFPSQFDPTLKNWKDQGILLINTAFTVEHNKTGSHTNMWKGFTSRLIKIISDNKEDVVFLLWGRQAQNFELFIDKNKHTVLTGIHPAALAYRTGWSNATHVFEDGINHLNFIKSKFKFKFSNYDRD